jgi:hypothetical protein
MNLPRNLANNWLDMDTELRAFEMTLDIALEAPLKTASFISCLQAIRSQCLERERLYRAFAGEVRNYFLGLTQC